MKYPPKVTLEQQVLDSAISPSLLTALPAALYRISDDKQREGVAQRVNDSQNSAYCIRALETQLGFGGWSGIPGNTRLLGVSTGGPCETLAQLMRKAVRTQGFGRAPEIPQVAK